MADRNLFELELNQVIVEGSNRGVGKVILNRPQKLNCLTYDMLSQLWKALQSFEVDPEVKLVILKAKGNAFCAGGDVTKAVQFMLSGHHSFGGRFYRKQLVLDYLIATYKKPMVALTNGIVMGGGAGITMHGKFRIVTEKTVFAMPEASIGLFPDVGASYFLSRLPGYFGEYLGLTGARIDGSEMLACGLATHFVPSKDLPSLEIALSRGASEASEDGSTVDKIISAFAVHEPHLKRDSAFRRLEIINRCFSGETVEEILKSLEREAASLGTEEKWTHKAIKSMKAASPTSLKISIRSIREGRKQNLEQCLVREYMTIYHVTSRSINNDFYEGSRARLFDKDNKPKWEPSKLELVTEAAIDKYFTDFDDDDWDKLELPKGRRVTNSTFRTSLPNPIIMSRI